MKKVIHFKIDFNKDKPDEINFFSKKVKEVLPDYTIIFTPYDITFEDENDLALNLDGINYTVKQLEEKLEKASMYDGLQ